MMHLDQTKASEYTAQEAYVQDAVSGNLLALFFFRSILWHVMFVWHPIDCTDQQSWPQFFPHWKSNVPGWCQEREKERGKRARTRRTVMVRSCVFLSANKTTTTEQLKKNLTAHMLTVMATFTPTLVILTCFVIKLEPIHNEMLWPWWVQVVPLLPTFPVLTIITTVNCLQPHRMIGFYSLFLVCSIFTVHSKKFCSPNRTTTAGRVLRVNNTDCHSCPPFIPLPL